jgi:hypothetical protein
MDVLGQVHDALAAPAEQRLEPVIGDPPPLQRVDELPPESQPVERLPRAAEPYASGSRKSK